MKQKSNKTIVLECYRKIIRDLDLSHVDNYIHHDYRQHSPTVKDGKAGLLEMLAFLKTLPRSAEKSPTPIIRVIAEDDLVAVHLDVKFMGGRAAVVDLFRVRDGKLAEHWDVSQSIQAESGAVTMTNGTTVIEDTDNVPANKNLVKSLFVQAEQTESLTILEFFTDGFIEHNALSGLLSIIERKVRIHRILGEGNFVAIHFESAGNGKSCAGFSMLKIEDGKIAEHWSVEQEVPETMAHGNGMF